MELMLLSLAVILFISLLGGLLRVILGPTPADRMLAAQLMGTSGVAILLLLAQAFQLPSLRDVTLTFSLLAAMAAVAFVQRPFGDHIESKP